MSDKMTEQKNINIESDFENRTGLVVWLTSKRNVKRLMKFGVLHYVSSKMDYALLYVNAKDVDTTIKKIENENYVKKVEKSLLRDLPVTYEDTLVDLQNEIDEKKREEKIETFSKNVEFNENEY